MSPLRVAFISVVPSPYQRDLFAALARRDDLSIRVFYMEKGAPDSPWPEEPLGAHEEILPGFWFAVSTARIHVNWRLPDLSSYDVVVLNTLMSITAQRVMRLSLRGRRWLFWGERLKEGGRIHQMLCQPLHRASAIAGIGRLATENYRERFPEPHHFNIPYYCDLKAFRTSPRKCEPDGKVIFLFCGQMIRRKGIDLLLSAFQQVSERARLLLVGREAELPEQLATLPSNVRERIHYAGFQSPQTLPEFFAQADVFVLPSRYDGWGVVVNQAVGAGLPLICSDGVGAAFDLLQPEENGLSFPSGNASALAICMQRMIDSPDLVSKWGAVSGEMAEEWSPECGAKKWSEVLASVSAR